MQTVLYAVAMTAIVVRPASCTSKRYDHHVLGTSLTWPDPYEARAVIHSRLQITKDGRMFLVSPRFRPGVPFTLGTFRVTTANRAVVEPEILPLPTAPKSHRTTMEAATTKSTEAATTKSTEAVTTNFTQPPLINVIDICLDDTKDVLWLLDVGVVNTMTNNPKRIAAAKIVRLEVDDDDDDDYQNQPYKTLDIDTDTNNRTPVNSCLQYIVMFRSRVADGGYYAFVSDASRSSVLVINTDTGVQWSVEFPERISHDVPRDVMFITVLRTSGGRSALYVTFLSGCRVFTLDLEHLDQCMATSSRPAIVEIGRKPYRITVLGSDTGSRLYFRRPTENEIWLWDANSLFQLSNFVLVSKGRDCRAPVHVVPGYGGFVFVLKNNFADYVQNTTGSMGAYTIIQPVVVLPTSCLITAATNRSLSNGTCGCPIITYT